MATAAPAAPMPELPISVLRTFNYSWRPINYDYDALTKPEQSVMPREDFDAIVAQILKKVGVSRD